MRVTARIAEEMIHHEALVRKAYKDSVGIWTWSVGLTSRSGHNVERYIGKPQPLEHCLGVYLWALDSYAEAVSKRFLGFDLNEQQFGCALMWHYNTGGIATASWPRYLMSGQLGLAESSFKSWNKGTVGGKKVVIPGLVSRRSKEWDLFENGTWLSDGYCTEFTKLRSNSQVDFKSGIQIPIRETLVRLVEERNREKDQAA